MQVIEEDPYAQAARLTIELINHSHVPDDVSTALLETIIEMSENVAVNLWLKNCGLSPIELTHLYNRQKNIGGGKRRAIMYGDYETGCRSKRRVAEKLRLIREHFGLSVDQLAERLENLGQRRGGRR